MAIDIESAAKEVLGEYNSGKHPKGIGYKCFDRYITDEHINTFQEGDCPFCESGLKDENVWHCSFGGLIVPSNSSVGYRSCENEECSFGVGYVYVGEKYLVSRRSVSPLPEDCIPLVNAFASGHIQVNEEKLIRDAMQEYFSDISFSKRWIT